MNFLILHAKMKQADTEATGDFRLPAVLSKNISKRSKRMKRVLLLSLGLLLLCFPLIGCDSEEGLASEKIAEIVEGVSTSEADTCTFDMDISANVEVDAGGQSFAVSVDGWGEGSMDNVDQAMHMPITINANVPGLGDQTISLEMYIVDGWMYMNMDGEWTKMELPQEMLGEQDQSILIGQLTELLALVEIDHRGSETINGVDCYKFQITPDLGQLAESAFEQFQQPGMDDFELDGLEEMISAFSVDCTFWIAKDDNLLMKIELDLGGELSSEDIPELGMVDFGSMSLDMNMEIVFDYNESVNIVLPNEALDAYYQGDYEI
ncbi:DUF6612 family protein [Chloroflexota bacterium]